MATSNLPPKIIEDSAAATRLFFDRYGEQPLEFNSTEVDACIGFFEKKGFDKDSSIVTSSILLRQAKLDGTPIFSILDTLSGFNGADLSILVSQILNNNRIPTSILGIKTPTIKTDISRNIAA